MNFKKLVLPFVGLLSLAGCNQNNVKLYPKYVLESEWGEAAKECYDMIGTVIPYFECESFETKSEIDPYGDGSIYFYLTFESDEKCEEAYLEYGDLASRYGFDVSYQVQTEFDYDNLVIYQFDICYMDIVFKQNLGLEIQMVYANNVLLLFCETYLYIPENEYPLLALEKLLDGNMLFVPQIKQSEDYTYYFEYYAYSNALSLTIGVSGCTYEIEEEFYNTCSRYGAIMVEYDENDEEYENVLMDQKTGKTLDYPEYDYLDNTYFMAYVREDLTIEFFYSLSYNAFYVTYYRF